MSDTIDITPTWESTIKMYLNLWDSLDQNGKKIARQEIERCAQLADKYVEQLKQES